MAFTLEVIILSFIAVIGSVRVAAQEFYDSKEYGIMLGGAQYFGDLNSNYGLKDIRPGVGVFYKHHFNPYISVRGMLNYASVGYSDQLSSNPYQQRRNLSFNSDIFELAVLGEFNFFWFSTGDINKRRYTPYLALGIGGFYYSPYVNIKDKREYLRPLGTEGQNLADYQNRKYSNFSFCLPIGAGIKYWLRPGVNLSFEILNRFTFTDYLDDVSTTYVGVDKFPHNAMRPSLAFKLQDRSSLIEDQKMGIAGKQRGDQSTKDQYLMMQLSISFQLKTYKCPSHLEGVWIN